jgi:DNA replication protein DnaC
MVMNSCTDDTLKAMADRLNLTYLRDHIEEIISETSICRMNSREILQFVFKKEIERREENRIRLGIMSAHFPRRCSLNSFDFDVQPGIDMAIIRELKTLSWVENGSNILFLGPPGVGKTHLAIGFGMTAIENGYSVLFRTAEALIKELLEAQAQGKLEQKLQKLSKVKVLIIDEFGYFPVTVEGAHLLFQLVNRRYESRSTIVTSNRPVRDWGLILGDSTAATAILDRLLHHSCVLTINGDSYRLMSARKEKLLEENDK